MTNAMTVTALNIMDGLDHHTYWDRLQPVWDAQGWGFLGFCGWIADVAELVNRELLAQGECDFPGVFDYEVSYPLGEQIRMRLVCNPELGFPTDDELCQWINILIEQFFGK